MIYAYLKNTSYVITKLDNTAAFGVLSRHDPVEMEEEGVMIVVKQLQKNFYMFSKYNEDGSQPRKCSLLSLFTNRNNINIVLFMSYYSMLNC